MIKEEERIAELNGCFCHKVDSMGGCDYCDPKEKMMFEVGKKYRAKKYSPHHLFHCLFVDGDNAAGYDFLTDPNNARYKAFAYHTRGEFKSQEYYELPPELKRWSLWSGVHTGKYTVAHAGHDNREQAIKSSSYIGTNKHASGYLLRQDFEQQEGKEAVCVNVELEKV